MADFPLLNPSGDDTEPFYMTEYLQYEVSSTAARCSLSKNVNMTEV